MVFLIRSFEDILKNIVLANLWQESGIYGLIDGAQAIHMLKKSQSLLLRFSLRYQCLCVTLKEKVKAGVPGKTKHELLPDGLQPDDHTWDEYELVMANGKSTVLSHVGLYDLYNDPVISGKREGVFNDWHKKNYPLDLLTPEEE